MHFIVKYIAFAFISIYPGYPGKRSSKKQEDGKIRRHFTTFLKYFSHLLHENRFTPLILHPRIKPTKPNYLVWMMNNPRWNSSCNSGTISKSLLCICCKWNMDGLLNDNKVPKNILLDTNLQILDSTLFIIVLNCIWNKYERCISQGTLSSHKFCIYKVIVLFRYCLHKALSGFAKILSMHVWENLFDSSRSLRLNVMLKHVKDLILIYLKFILSRISTCQA